MALSGLDLVRVAAVHSLSYTFKHKLSIVLNKMSTCWVVKCTILCLVTFDDERPKQGYCKVHLKIPGMKAGGMFSGGAPKNADVKQATIDTE